MGNLHVEEARPAHRVRKTNRAYLNTQAQTGLLPYGQIRHLGVSIGLISFASQRMTTRIILGLSLAFLIACHSTLPSEPTQADPIQTLPTVTRVIDGDTVVVDGIGTVRLIGVDTPETVDPRRPVQYFGKEASDFTKQLATGKRVRLEFDQDRTDRYGRTLAYVYLQPENLLLNAEIIRQGYGFAYTQFPFRMMEQFRTLEREAREAGRGLWAAGP